MILIIDNYDSFTYNLYQYIGELDSNIEVYRNDKITIKEIIEKAPTHIIISPGPGFPKDAGIIIDLIRSLGGKIPILGICLGHQAIAQAYGGKIVHADELFHGKADTINIEKNCPIFNNLDNQIQAARYHSLIAQKNTLPTDLVVTATTNKGEIMGVKHKQYNVYGIQFHPESFLTPCGKQILKNFLEVKEYA